MKSTKIVSVGLTLLMGFGAFAQESSSSSSSESTQTTIKKSDVVPADKEVKDIDEEITNKKLRAELGSKNKYSMSLSLGYSGGSVEKPLDKIRPNYRASRAGVMTKTSLAGTVAMRYRLTERDSLSLGTGVFLATPLHNTLSEVSSNVGADKRPLASVSTPYITYSRAYRVGGIQNITSGGYSHTTVAELIDVDKSIGSVDLSHTILGSPMDKLDIGLAAGIDYSIYSDGIRADETRPDVTIGFFPFLEYALTEKASFRTVFGYFNYEKVRGSNTFESWNPYQSMGLGYSVTRDVFVYPNLQFRPDNLRADLTNVAISATINL